MTSAHHFDTHSEDYVMTMRIRFREQAARFLEDVSFDVGAVLARDLSLQDEDTKNKLSELQKGLTEQVQHMQKAIKKEKSALVASTIHKHKKDIHFTQNELKTLQEIAKQEKDGNGVVTMFLKRREEGVARNRYKEFVKRAEAKYFEHRRDGRKGKFNFRHIIRDSMRISTNSSTNHQTEAKKHSKGARVPKLIMPVADQTKEGGGLASNVSMDSSNPARTEISAHSTHPSTNRSAPNLHCSGLVSHRISVLSARWNQQKQLDPDKEAVVQILNELSETVELLVDFEHQPFHTAVPPRYHFCNSSSESAAELKPDQLDEGEHSVSEHDESRDSDHEDGLDGEMDSIVSEDHPSNASQVVLDLGQVTNGDCEDAVNEPAGTNDEHLDKCPDVDNINGPSDQIPTTATSDRDAESVPIENNLQPAVKTLQEENPEEDHSILDHFLAIEMQSAAGEQVDLSEEEDCEQVVTEPKIQESKSVAVLLEKPAKSAPSGNRSSNKINSRRFMSSKRIIQPEPAPRCHRNRERKSVTSHLHRNGNRSRSPWRHPERFPQIRDAQSRPNPKKQPASSLSRNRSTTKLPEAK